MKRMLACLAIVVVGIGLFAVRPLLYAAETGDVAPLAQTPLQPEEEAAWDAWNTDFWPKLEADETYLAARKAWMTYAGDDDAEYARLEAVVNDRFRAVARIVYERHFGPWTGSNVDFDELIQLRAKSPVKECSETAIQTCGEGRVCSLTVESGLCSFTCQDGQGNCPQHD